MTKTPAPFRPRRGRPDAKQTAAIDRAILETARTRFLADGYDAVAMEGIASETGVSKGTLYARYPSKELLFTAVIEASVRTWSDLSGENDHLLPDDIGDRLRHHARTIARVQLWPDVRAFQRLLLSNGDRFPALARAMYESGYLHITRLIARDIRDAGARDAMPPRDPDSIAATLVTAISGWALQESGGRDLTTADVEAYADRLVDLLTASRPVW